MKINVIIPTLNAEKTISKLIEGLSFQTYKPNEIIIVDSSSEDKTIEILKGYENVKIYSIDRKDFSHGKTRSEYAKKTDCDYLVYMVQDAIPYDDKLIENLIKPMVDDENISSVYARQIPYDDASPSERLTRKYNYPEVSLIKSLADKEKLGIKTYFCSNACSAYNKKIFDSQGGFNVLDKTNEDMFYNARALSKGYKNYYCSDAIIYHSHNLTYKQQYNRYRLLGYELERNKDLLKNVNATNEGYRLFIFVSKGLLKDFKIFELIYFIIECFVRLFAIKKGRKDYFKDAENSR